MNHEDMLRSRAVCILSISGWDYHDIGKVLNMDIFDVEMARKIYNLDRPHYIEEVRNLLLRLENKGI